MRHANRRHNSVESTSWSLRFVALSQDGHGRSIRPRYCFLVMEKYKRSPHIRHTRDAGSFRCGHSALVLEISMYDIIETSGNNARYVLPRRGSRRDWHYE
ncbi:unnamed protein product [Danaus chrysippus]|uniref:(African queen) hypothetical protein n=1 Tax=Danaus chrysippus TaxID=151541 RepID=A0A8J2VR48_9NEOP|nr:unnamed protein product [Danaus chrysippus]